MEAQGGNSPKTLSDKEKAWGSESGGCPVLPEKSSAPGPDYEIAKLTQGTA